MAVDKKLHPLEEFYRAIEYAQPDDGCHGCQEVWQCGDSLEYWGYFYSTVLTADEKCWFAENLRTEKFQSGDQIEVFIDEGQSISGLSWGQLAGSGSTMINASPALAINSTHSYVPIGSPDIYMYSFASVVNSSGLCPAGWHVPVKEEFAFNFMNNYIEENVTIGKTDKIVLSNREKEILNLIANGKTSKEISETLFIAKTTVDTHRKNMIRKLNLDSGSELIKYAIDKKYEF